MTMAAPPITESTHTGGPRWTAVSVAVDPQEAALSLEREMSMAFRAFTSDVAAQAGPATMADEPQSSAITATAPEATVQFAPVNLSAASAPVDSAIETQTEIQPALTPAEASADLSQTEGNAFAVTPVQEIPDHSEPAAAQPDYPAAIQRPQVEAVSENVAPENACVENAVAETAIVRTAEVALVVATAGQEEIKREEIKHPETPQEQFSAQTGQLGISAASEFASESSASETASAPTLAQISASDGSASETVIEQPAQAQPEPLLADGPVMAEATASEIVEVIPAEIVAEIPQSSSQSEIPRENESQLAEATAAAWASWRQIRDSIPGPKNHGISDSAAEPALESAPAMAPSAMAVAAGAEGSPVEASAAPGTPAGMNSQTVASIVDSLLAELRPKIVEEISRKLAAEKK